MLHTGNNRRKRLQSKFIEVITMFRELSRKNRAASQEECIRLLETEKRGVLAVQGDDGYP